MKKYLQKNNKISYSDNWATPKEIYNYYCGVLNYYDPCPLMGKGFDLSDRPSNNQFINPPYSEIENWVDYSIECHKLHNQPIILLVASRTDTKWFHKLLEYGVVLEFIKGRLRFGDGKKSAPFPSVLVTLIGKYNE